MPHDTIRPDYKAICDILAAKAAFHARRCEDAEAAAALRELRTHDRDRAAMEASTLYGNTEWVW